MPRPFRAPAVVAALALVRWCAATPRYAIRKGAGGGDTRVDDLRSFLALAQLDEEDYEERLLEAGVQLGAIPSVDEELLETVGMRKRFHRKRFLRYAKLLEVVDSDGDVEPTQAQRHGEQCTRKGPQAREVAVTAGDANSAEEALSRRASVDALISVAKAEPHTSLMHCSWHGFADVARVIDLGTRDIDLGAWDTLARVLGVVYAATSLARFAVLCLRLAAKAILLLRLATRSDASDAGAATATSATECPLCFEQYCDSDASAEGQPGLRVPRILQCGHSACHGCYALMLRPLVADGGFKRLECPECREVTDVPRGRADQLPKNFALMKL